MPVHLSEAEAGPIFGKPKRSKYHARQVVVTEDGQLYDAKAAKANGIVGRRFDSKAEARRYLQLRVLERAGQITELQCQPKFDIHAAVRKVKVATYRADFAYLELRYTDDPDPDLEGKGVWCPVVEDVKGCRTAVYALKKKLVEAEHGVEIREIR